MSRHFTIIICLLPAASFAQIGTWNIVNLKINTSDRLSFFGEAQLRSLKTYDHFHYHEFKGGATLTLKKNLSFTTGLGSYNTYAEGGNFKQPMLNKEFRTWLQVSTRQNYGRVNAEHRYRAEQRWTSYGYRNRFRYRINATIPLNTKKIEKGTFYSILWNEIFFTDKAPYFERNRYFAGFGYEISKSMALQTGYLNQFDYKVNDETGRDFIQLSLLFSLDVKSRKTENIPNTID